MNEISIPADKWCQEQLEEYDLVVQTLKVLKASPQSDSVSGIIWSAKIKRLEKILEVATIKADVACFLRQLITSAPTGEVSINTPAADLKVNLKW